MDIKITPEAHGDILNIYNYVKKDGGQTAKKQAEYIYDGIENLGRFPNMGSSLQKYVERITPLRFLVIHKVYIAIYDVTDAVEIIRIFRKDQDFISALGIGDEDD